MGFIGNVGKGIWSVVKGAGKVASFLFGLGAKSQEAVKQGETVDSGSVFNAVLLAALKKDSDKSAINPTTVFIIIAIALLILFFLFSPRRTRRR